MKYGICVKYGIVRYFICEVWNFIREVRNTDDSEVWNIGAVTISIVICPHGINVVKYVTFLVK